MSDETGVTDLEDARPQNGKPANNAEASASVSTSDLPLVLLILIVISFVFATVALIALSFVLRELSDVMDEVQESAIAVELAEERADKAERSAALSREYAVSAFFQTQVEWAKRGVVIESPLEHHDPIPEEAYIQHDTYLEEAE